MAGLAKPEAIIGSSTSGLPASSFTADITGRERCLVAHPINPPHLIPLVEIIPAPWTKPDVVERTSALMKQIGQVPIRLKREIAGFVVNRLQGAMLGEAFRLVEDGICSATDIDAAVSEGLGLRWFFMGPFETIDLNAQAASPITAGSLVRCTMTWPRNKPIRGAWGEALVAKVEAQRREKTAADQLDARKAWRDRCLAALVKAKRAVLKGECVIAGGLCQSASAPERGGGDDPRAADMTTLEQTGAVVSGHQEFGVADERRPSRYASKGSSASISEGRRSRTTARCRLFTIAPTWCGWRTVLNLG